MRRVVCYSLALEEERTDLLWQLEASAESLRLHNPALPAFLFAYAPVHPAVRTIADRWGLTLVEQEQYATRLARLCPEGWRYLREYPLLHKFLNGAALTQLQVDQALILDCDTLCFRDLTPLFEHYDGAHVVAREEPTTRRSHYGYDPLYIDEDLLRATAAAEGSSPPPPFNLGVVLLNRDVIHALPGLEHTFVDYAWRFLLWMALHPLDAAVEHYGESAAIAATRRAIEHGELRQPTAVPLRYPAGNRWILDQMALWFAMGTLRGLAYQDFSPSDVAQNGEVLDSDPRAHSWSLCHYYSQNLNAIDSWLRSAV